MNKSLFLAMGLFSITAIAQTGKVGINNEKPTATLSVKSKTGKDATTQNLQLENAENVKLVTVLDNGNVGIGIENPIDAKLEIKGSEDLVTRFLGKDGDTVADFYMDKKNMSVFVGSKSQSRPLDGAIFVNNENPNALKVGIGANNPSERLDVEGNARIRQMPSGLDENTYTKAVVADANGNLAVVSRTNPTLPNSTQTIFANKAQPKDVMLGHTFKQIQDNMSTLGNFYFRYTGQSITLPPGKWIVYCGYLLGDADLQYYTQNNTIMRHNVWVRGIIDDNPNNGLRTNYIAASINGSPVLISTNMIPGSYFSQATGLWFVDNTTTSNKTYYLKISFEPRNFRPGDTQKLLYNTSIYGEDYMIAIRRQ